MIARRFSFIGRKWHWHIGTQVIFICNQYSASASLQMIFWKKFPQTMVNIKYGCDGSYLLKSATIIAQKMKFSSTDFFSKCDKLRGFMGIWSHLLKKSETENFIFCAVIIKNTVWNFFELTINTLSSWSVSLNFEFF